jgi:hypothetical protein
MTIFYPNEEFAKEMLLNRNIWLDGESVIELVLMKNSILGPMKKLKALSVDLNKAADINIDCLCAVLEPPTDREGSRIWHYDFDLSDEEAKAEYAKQLS